MIRRQGGLLEHWSPASKQGKEVLWHWDPFFGRGRADEKVEVSAIKTSEIIGRGVVGDTTDGD